MLPRGECSPGLAEVLPRDEKHAEALAVFLRQVLVVHLVCPTDGEHVGTFRSSKPLETLVYKHIMYKEISNSV
jgi:hypothetical protein